MTLDTSIETRLAIQGGPKAVPDENPDLFRWPIVTSEDERAVIEVLRSGNMSGTDISELFQNEWGQYLGTKYNLTHPNGTMALLAAMFGVKLGRGDEMIVPSITYWASGLQVMSLGATPVFADIDPESLCIDPKDIERHISPRTKALMVVHYCGHPCDMDAILPIVKKHKLKLIEDCSHAQGTVYKGRKVGTFGDVAGLSMMAGKSFAIGEGGMLSTNDRDIYERAIALAHYEKTTQEIKNPELRRIVCPDTFPTGLPLGGMKGRLNQTCAAMGRVQLKYYQKRIEEIQRGMNRFWDLLEGVPGLRAHRPAKGSGSTMGGWYNPLGIYVPDELDGLPLQKFLDAVIAEGGRSGRAGNFPLHLHPVFNEADVYNDGKPTRIAFSDRDLRQRAGSLPVSEKINNYLFGLPYFKHDRPELIEQYATAFRKVATQADKLL
jgi:dTDP-4-amino-4,6-dideoxygalactose transaminase